MDSIYSSYVALLYITESHLLDLIDRYNQKKLTDQNMIKALEILDGLPIDD